MPATHVSAHRHLQNRIPGNTAAGKAVAVKLRDRLGISDDHAEQLKDVAFGFALGLSTVVIPLVSQILLRAQ